MTDNVFQKSPSQLVLEQAGNAGSSRGLPDFSPRQAFPPEVMKSAFEEAALRYNVPVNVLMASAEKSPDASRAPMMQIDGAARSLRKVLDGGARIEDVVPADVLARATKINGELYADRLKPQEEVKPKAEPAPEADQGDGLWGTLRDMTLQATGGAYKGTGSLLRGAGALPQMFAENVTAPIVNKIFGADYQPGNLLDPAADALQEIGKAGQAGVSSDTKEAIKNSTPDGDILKPSTWTLGKAPSLRGYMALGLDIFGGMAPIIAATVATGGGATAAIVGATTGGLQGGGSAIETARDAVNEMANTPSDGPGSAPLIEQQSAYYRELRASGKSHEQAVKLTRSAAERFAFLFTTPVSALGGAATSKIIHPAEHILASRAIGSRIGGRAALGALEEGSQEVAETVETNKGINTGAGTDRSLTDGTFSDFLLGAMGGAAPAAAGGALSRRQTHGDAGGTAPGGAPAGLGTEAQDTQVTADAIPAVDQPFPMEAGRTVPIQATGPLSRAMERIPGADVAPHALAAVPEAPEQPRVTVTTDGIEPFDGVVEGQDAEGVTVRDDAGNRYTIPHDDISSGVVNIEQSGAPAAVEPPQAPVETPSVADAAPEAVVNEQPTVEEPAAEGDQIPAPTDAEVDPAPPAEPAAAEVDQTAAVTARDGQPFPSKGAALQALRSQGKAVDAYDLRPVDGGHVAVPKTAVRDAAAANYAGMSAEELTGRLDYLTKQARTNGGWDKRLTGEREKVEAALKDLNGGVGDVPIPDVGGQGGDAAAAVEGDRRAGADSVPADAGDRRAGGGRSSPPVAGADVPEGIPAPGSAADAKPALIRASNDKPFQSRGAALQALKSRGEAAADFNLREVDGGLVAERKPAEGQIVDAAAHEAATSPHNDRPEPTQAQKEAGNYKVGRLALGGLDISVENPQGSERKGVDRGGKPWSVEMKQHYGYIRGTVGRDKDHVDVFVKPGTTEMPDDAPVFVVDQNDPQTGKFDEHKVMLGFGSVKQAEMAYRSNYTKGWMGTGAITPMTMGAFREWVKDPANTSKPAKAGVVANASQAEHPGLIIKSLQTDKVTRVQPIGTVPPKATSGQIGAQATVKDASHTVATVAKPSRVQDEPNPAAITKLRDTNSYVVASLESAIPQWAPGSDGRKHLEGKLTLAKRLEALSDDQWVKIQPHFDDVEPGHTREPKKGMAVLDRVLGAEADAGNGTSSDTATAKPTDDTSSRETDAAAIVNERPEVSKNSDPKSPAYGADNKLVSADRAEELRKRLKAKLRNQLNSGIDPEVLPIGAELAAFHLEVGARRFVDFAQAMARDLDTAIEKIKPYLRAWYNGARDMMEDAGHDIAGTDTPETVRAELGNQPANRGGLAEVKERHGAAIEQTRPEKKEAPKEGSEGEKPAMKYSLSNLPVVDVPTDEIAGIESAGQARQKVRMLARERLNGKVVTTLDGDEVLISWQGIKHGANNANMPALAALLKIDELISSSIKVAEAEDYRERRNVEAMHEYSARAKLGNDPALVRIFVREDLDGKRYYDHAVIYGVGSGWSTGEGSEEPNQSHHLYGPEPTLDTNLGPLGSGFKSVSDAQDHLRSGAYGTQIGKMMDADRVVIHKDQGSLPGSGHPDGRVQAMTTPDGKVHLVAANLTPANAQGVLLHELFHSGAQNMLGAQRYAKLMQRVRTSLAAAEQRRFQMTKGAAERFWQGALKRVDAASVPANLRAEELAAYAIEHRDAAPVGLREAVDGIIGTVKDWAVRTLGLQIGEVTPAQLHALARSILRAPSALRGAPKPTRQGQAKAFSLKDFEPNDFIPAPDGTLDFGRIDGEVAQAIGREAAPIRVKAGNEAFGLRHIEMKGEEISNTYKDTRDFIADIAKNYDAIYRASGQRLFLAMTVPGRNRSLIVELNPTPDGAAYVVVTGGMRRDGYFARKEPLWERAPSNQAVAGSPDAISGQSGDNTIPPSEDDAKGTRYSLADAIKTTPEQKDAWLRHKLSDGLTKAMSGKWSLLAAAPLRPMLEELGKGMPATRDYLHTKQAMDALRNEWHAKVAATSDAWLKYRTHNRAENARLMEVMHETTLAQVDPTKPFEPIFGAKEATVMRFGNPDTAEYHEAARKAEEDKKRRVAYKETKTKYEALSPEAKAMYATVRDTYAEMADSFEKVILANMDKALKIAARRAERAHRQEMQRVADEGLTGTERDEAIKDADRKLKTVRTKTAWNAKWRLSKMRGQFESNRLPGPYFPLTRFGNFFVTVRDESGKVVSFSRFESPAKQRSFADEMRRDPAFRVEEGVLAETDSTRQQVDPNFVADVEDILNGADVPDGVKDQVWQRYLESLPDYSIRKNRIHRIGRAGFQADALRAFASNLFHGAHQLARTKYGMDLAEHVNEAREQAKEAPDPKRAGLLVDEMDRRHAYVMNPQGSAVAQTLTSAAFFMSLAASPAAALVNISQTVIMGVPILGAYHGGIARASAEITKATRDFTLGWGHAERSKRLTDNERSAMAAAYNSGVIDKSQAHDLAGIGETGVEYSSRRQKVMNAISWGFHQGERFNREVTFLAAYRMARSKGEGHSEAINTASSLTWRTHFDYQNTSRPRMMHGDAAKVALTFRNYNVNMLFRLFRDTHQALHGATDADRKEARAQLFGITAMMVANAGIKGTWMFGIATLLAGLFFGLSGRGDDDPEEELQKAAVNLLGPTVAGIALNGLPGHLMGISLSDRIGMPDLWFRSPDRQLEGADAYHYWQDQALGAVFGIGQNWFRGYKLITDGHTERGIEAIAPKAIRDLMRAARYLNEGATTLNGDQLVDDLSAADLFKQALGFTPAQIAERYQLNTWDRNHQEATVRERKSLLNDFARANKAGDADATARVNKVIGQFNARHPDDAITGKTIIQSVRAREKASVRTENGLLLNKKLGPGIRSRSAPPIYD